MHPHQRRIREAIAISLDNFKAMKRIGTFKIQDSFNITGRGRMITGQILSGVIRINASTHLKVDDRIILCQIKDVDTGKPMPQQESIVGILLSSKDIDLKDHKIKEQQIDIFEM